MNCRLGVVNGTQACMMASPLEAGCISVIVAFDGIDQLIRSEEVSTLTFTPERP